MNIRPVVSHENGWRGGDLACCVQYFAFIFLASELDGFAESVFYCWVITLHEMTIDKLYCKRTFAY